ncbi:MAG: M14 family metallopeptidase [Gemmatimonadales bacterium]|nr:M14 family metallopeptidase [Gemmatimonadales bacterium]
MRRLLTAVGSVSLIAHSGLAQSTRPERTGFRETSSLADVRSFLDSLQRRGAGIRVGILAASPEGRAVPYVIASRPLVSTPAEAKRSGKLVVWLQANIHAGEVEGKEAAQMLLRDLTLGPLRALLDSLVLIVVPIYNTDGNERLGPGQVYRPEQNGPAIVGRNQNGQYLNLNRDYVKMEAPETRGAAVLIERWDPDLFIDLHTTDGSYHGYALTYAPGLNPNASPSGEFARAVLLPQARERLRRLYRTETFSYGNFRNQEPDSLVLGWETYDARPRFGTNWMALRGRVAVLSEGYSHADFRTRITATRRFVREVLGLAAAATSHIHALTAASDRQRPDSVIVRSVLAPPDTQEVIAELTGAAGAGSDGYAPRRRTGVFRRIRMPVYGRFAAARREARPAAYLVPGRLRSVVSLLRAQGIVVERVRTPWRGVVDSFTVDSLVVEPVFEGHRTVRAEGRWRAGRHVAVSPGTFLIRTRQPLGLLASYLLEPASEDGVVTWNLLDRELEVNSAAPIARVASVEGTVTEMVP